MIILHLTLPIIAEGGDGHEPSQCPLAQECPDAISQHREMSACREHAAVPFAFAWRRDVVGKPEDGCPSS